MALGGSARFSDPLGFDALSIEASYSPDPSLPGKERLTSPLICTMHAGRPESRGIAADFYDLFGPTKRSLAGYNGYVGYDLPLAFEPPEIARLHRQGRLLRRPRHLAGRAKRDFTVQSPVHSRRRLRPIGHAGSPGAVDDETGHGWSIMATANGATATSYRASPVPSTSASRCRSIIPRSGCAPAPASPPATRY